MKRSLRLLVIPLLSLGCGSDDPASNDVHDAGSDDSMSATDSGPGRDAGPGDGDAGGDGNVDAGGDGDGDGDGDAGGPLPMPTPDDCGAGIEADECPPCANTATCDAPSYTDNGNGTVTSSCCGLTWQKAVEDVDRTWVEAYEYCEALSLAGGNWRLPTVAELKTIVVEGMRPSIDQTVFPSTPVDGYWTSSDGHGNAWQVQFFNGVAQIGDLFNPDRVRCVR